MANNGIGSSGVKVINDDGQAVPNLAAARETNAHLSSSQHLLLNNFY